MLSKQVKASAITNLTDARYFAAWHVDWLGFKFEGETGDTISPNEVLAIQEWIEGPKIVGEFENLPASEILQLAEHCQLEVLEVPITYPEIEALKDWKLGIKINSDEPNFMNQWAHIQQMKLNLEYVLLYGKNQQEQITLETPILLDFKSTSNDTKLEQYGLSVQGGAEEKVGSKLFDELDDLFDALMT